METAGKHVEDEEMRELMKDSGIGRPSTRANIIETLFRRKYIEKKRKNLIATNTGIALINTIQSDLLKSAELTGQWERKLRLIEKGEYKVEVFKNELFSMVRELTDEVVFSSFRPMTFDAPQKEQKKRKKVLIDFADMTCPKCKKEQLMKGKTAVGCSNYTTCGFKIPFELMGKNLSDSQLKMLIEKGKTRSISGIISATGEISGKFILEPDFNIKLEE